MSDPLEKVTDRVNDMAQGLKVVENEQKHYDFRLDSIKTKYERRMDSIEADINLITKQIVTINNGNIELQSSGKAVIKTMSVLFTIITVLGSLALTWIAMQIN